MIYKSDIKQNHSKCRELRETRDGIRSAMRTNTSERHDLFARIRATSAKREQLQRRYDSLKKQAGVAGALSFLPGNMGNTIGASGAGTAVQMAIIDSEIKDKVRELQQLEGRDERLNQERPRLDACLSENGARMDRLNCS